MSNLRNLKLLKSKIFDYVNSDYHDVILLGATAKRRLDEMVDVSVVPLHSQQDLILPKEYHFAYKLDGVLYWDRSRLGGVPNFVSIKKTDYNALMQLLVTLPFDAINNGVQMYVIKPGLVAFIVPICKTKEVITWDQRAKSENWLRGKQNGGKKDVKRKK